jgi:hypothetical protein
VDWDPEVGAGGPPNFSLYCFCLAKASFSSSCSFFSKAFFSLISFFNLISSFFSSIGCIYLGAGGCLGLGLPLPMTFLIFLAFIAPAIGPRLRQAS